MHSGFPSTQSSFPSLDILPRTTDVATDLSSVQCYPPHAHADVSYNASSFHDASPVMLHVFRPRCPRLHPVDDSQTNLLNSQPLNMVQLTAAAEPRSSCCEGMQHRPVEIIQSAWCLPNVSPLPKILYMKSISQHIRHAPPFPKFARHAQFRRTAKNDTAITTVLFSPSVRALMVLRM